MRRGEKPALVISVVICVILLMAFLIGIAESASEKTIKFGSASNFADRMGIQVKQINEMLTALRNETGGIVVKGEKYNLEMIVYDHKYSAEAGRAAGERLVFQDKVKFIVNTYGMAPSLAMLEITEPSKIPFFHSGAGAKLIDPKFKYAVHTKTFDALIMSEWGYWKEHLFKPNAKTIVMATYDDQTGHVIADMSEKAWTKAGMNVVGKLFFKRGQSDFSPLATKLKALNPDVFDLCGVMQGSEMFLAIKAAYMSGWRGQIGAEYAKELVPKIVAEIGKEAVEGLVCDYYDPTEMPDPPSLAKPFRDAYVKRYGVWETDGLQFVTGWWFLMEAIKKANSLDPDAVMAACKGLEIDWVGGRAKLIRRPDLGNDRYCDTIQDLYVGQVRDGKVVFHSKIGIDYILKKMEEFVGQSVR